MSIQEATDKLVQAGVKQDFAAKVVKNCGHKPSEILKDPARILEEYWYKNVEINFLDGGVAVTADQLKQGLTALHLQDSVVKQAYERAPSSEMLGHRDIYNWGLSVVGGRL